MANLRPQSTKAVLSYNKESTYGTAVIDANITKMYDLIDPGLAEMTSEQLDDSVLIKGHEFASDPNYNITLSRDATIPLKFPCNAEICGWLFAFGLGTYGVSGAGPYIHTITPQDGTTSDQLPSTSIVQLIQGDTATYQKLKGVCVEEIKLAVQNRGRVDVTGTLFSDGSLTASAGFAIPGSKETVTPIHGTGATFATADAPSAVVDKSSALRGWDFTWKNNLDRADARGMISTGLYLPSLRFGSRSCSLTVKIQGNKGDQYWTDWFANTTKNVEITLVQGADIIKIAMPRCIITNIKDTFDGIRNVNEITYRVLTTTTSSKFPCTVTITNTIAAYLL
jgi:hypothetical protein